MALGILPRLAAACGSGLGFSSSRIAAAVPAAASSGALRLRAYSDEASSSGKPAEEGQATAAAAGGEGEAVAAAAGSEGEAVAAAAEDAQELEEQEPEGVHPALIDPGTGEPVPPELFTKRQLAWMGVEGGDKYKHFLPRLSRKELGSFADEYVEEEFDQEVDLYPEVPDNVPLYDLRTTVPEIYQPRSDLFERLRRLKLERHPDMPVEQFVREVVGINAPEDVPPRPGARPIIRWRIHHMFSVGVTEGHPASRRVKAWVYLRDLQREHGLTDAALQHIAAICGPRYNPNTGELKLTSNRYPHREANRAHIKQILEDLVAEGHRKFPAPQQQQQQPAADQQQQQAAAP